MNKSIKATVLLLSVIAMPFSFAASALDIAPTAPGFNSAGLPPAALATEACQCVSYVRNRLVNSLGVPGAATKSGDAYLWGANLQSLGLRWFGAPRVGAAQPGDVVVFQPSYRSVTGGSFNTTYGHIGFVESASFNAAARTWTVTIFGANQGGALRTDQGCNNVSNITTTYKEFSNESSRTVSYYYLH